MSKHLSLLFDPNKTKCDKEDLKQQFCSFGLNFHPYFDDVLILIDKNVNISFGCSLIFIKGESWHNKGFYFDMMLSDMISKESLNYILSSFINISKSLGFKLIFDDTDEINEFNFDSFNFEKDKSKPKSAKEYYLGSVDTSPIIQKKPLNVNHLLTIEHEGYVVNIACANCGVVVEVLQEIAENFCRIANIPLRKDFEGKYFLTNYCLVCQAENGKFKAELKDISDLIN